MQLDYMEKAQMVLLRKFSDLSKTRFKLNDKESFEVLHNLVILGDGIKKTMEKCGCREDFWLKNV